MIVALAYCHKDWLAAHRLFEWMAELDGRQTNHSLVLLASTGMEQNKIHAVSVMAKLAFEKVETIMPRQANEQGWPISANHLFLSAQHFISRSIRTPFLWIEPDCVPLVPKWLDALSNEYDEADKPFMGCVYELPWPHVTGCAIYPANVEKYSPGILTPGVRAWDMVDTETTIANAHHSLLFHHEWGNFKYNIAPSFPSQASMKLLRKGAVLFHRCKDGSLIDRLRERREYPRQCKQLAGMGSASNLYQEFEDSHAPAAVIA